MKESARCHNIHAKVQDIKVHSHTAEADYGFLLPFPSTLHMGVGVAL